MVLLLHVLPQQNRLTTPEWTIMLSFTVVWIAHAIAYAGETIIAIKSKRKSFFLGETIPVRNLKSERWVTEWREKKLTLFNIKAIDLTPCLLIDKSNSVCSRSSWKWFSLDVRKSNCVNLLRPLSIHTWWFFITSRRNVWTRRIFFWKLSFEFYGFVLGIHNKRQSCAFSALFFYSSFFYCSLLFHHR